MSARQNRTGRKRRRRRFERQLVRSENLEQDDLGSCQDCGRLLFRGPGTADDVCAPAYVTASGDLFCVNCGRRQDERDEEAERDDYVDYDPREWHDYVEEPLAGEDYDPRLEDVGT